MHSWDSRDPLVNHGGRELDRAFRRLDERLDASVNRQHGGVNTLLRHLWGNNDLCRRHPLFGESDSLEVGEIFTDFVPPVSVHVKSVCTGSAFVQPLKVVDMGGKMAEEDGDLEGVLEVGVSDVESEEGSGGNATGAEDFITTSLRGQRELECVQTFTLGSEWNDALLHTRHQQMETVNITESTNQSNAWWSEISWPPGLGAQFQHLNRWADGRKVRDVRVIERDRLGEIDLEHRESR